MTHRPDESWRILLVDDDEDDYLLTRSMLDQAQGREIELDWASTYRAGQDLLESGRYHAILVDYDLGSRTGIGLIRQAVAAGCAAPLILYTGRGGYEVDLEAMQAGATLYLSKTEATPLLLERSLRYAIERKRIDEELDRRIRERSDILESIQDGFFTIDQEWRITYINQRASRNGGFEPEELVGRNIWEAFSRLRGTLLEENYRRVMQDRTPRQFEMHGLYQDVWYTISIYPFVEGISVYWQDISTRKKAEEVAQSRLVQLHAVIDSMNEGLMVADGDGNIVLSNPAMIRFAGWQEAPKEHLDEYANRVEVRDPGERPLPPEQWPLSRALRGESVRDVELTVHRRDTGKDCCAIYSAEPIRDAAGQVILAILTVRDITDRKRGEDALRESNELLRSQAEELEVQAEELQAQTGELEAANRQLQRSEALYRTIARNIPDGGVGVVDPDLRYIVVEGNLWDRLGLVQEHVEGRILQEVHDPQTAKIAETRFRHALAGNSASYETIIHGRVLWTQYVPLRDESGQVLAAMVLAQDITERRHAEQAIQWSRQDLARAQAVAHTGSWRLDVQNDELLWSDETYRIFGIPKGTPMTYDAFLATIHPDDRDSVERSWSAALRGELYDIEHRIIAGQEVKWVRERAELEFDRQGELLGGFGTVQDITAQKRAEQALLLAKEEWEQTFNSVPDLLAILDNQHRIVRVNRAMADRLGLEPEACIGLTCYQAVHKLSQPPGFCPHVLTCQDGQQHITEVHEPNLGGDFLVSTTPLFDQQGKLTGSVHVARDITERKRAEEALRASEERISLAIEGAGMATWDTDLQTGNSIWSRRHFELLGYPPAPDGQATLEMWRSRLHPEDLEQVMSAFERAKAERGLFSPEYRIIRADTGQIVWLRVFGRFFYDAAGQAVRFIGVFFDNTAFQEAARFIDAGQLLRPKADPESEALRQSGLDVTGAVPWGTHFCQFYATGQDLIETLVPYFHQGLLDNEFCMWITSAPLQAGQAEAALHAAVPDLDQYLARGQIEILDFSQWYTQDGAFDADRVLQGWNDKLAAALQRGFAGLRLSGNTFWLEQANWDDFKRYEEKINDQIGGQKMLALCTYSLEKCGVREILDVIANHQFALIKQYGRWEIIESAEHYQTRLALRESEERLRLAMWVAELGVFEWHLHSDRALWENRRMYEIFGRSQADGPLSKAQFIANAIHPDDVSSFETTIAEAMKPGRLFHAICRIRRQNDGELRWIEFSGRFERTPEGRPLLMMGVLGDITERKQAELDLAQANVALRANAEQLKQRNEALQDFAFIASHDLREPLRKVQVFGDLLQSRYSGQLGGEGLDYISRMQQAAGRMQAMLDGLLEYARVTTQFQPFERVDLAQVARDVLSDLEMRIRQTGGRVEIDNLPVIEADSLQMRQLLQNLIGNALKFHRPGTPPIVKVSAKFPLATAAVKSGRDGELVEVRVEDNGIGFDVDHAGHLFQPFRRMHNKTDYEGSGMGLAICRKIVERHRGSISASSLPGQGSTFTVTLPGRKR